MKRLALLCLLATSSALATEQPFAASTTVYSGRSFLREARLVDLDLDGDLDVLATNYWEDGPGGRVHFLENTAGDGSAWTNHELGGSTAARYAIAADFDGDGDVDIAALGPVVSTLWWIENVNGDWSSVTTTAIDTGWTGSWLGAADIDGDGDLDIASVDSATGG